MRCKDKALCAKGLFDLFHKVSYLSYLPKTWCTFCTNYSGRRVISAESAPCCRVTSKRSYHFPLSAYSEGATPKCLRKMVEKWARLEKPTV